LLASLKVVFLPETYIFKREAPLNGVEPLAWLTDVLERMVSGRTKAHELERLLPWAWKAERLTAAVDA
jgi:IS66 C-terminal element